MDKLSETFGVSPTPRREITTIIESDDTVDSDQIVVRQNIRDILCTGTDALGEALEVARASENPRAFEVVAGLMKTLAEINISLLETHERQKKLREGTATQNQPNSVVTNNIAFVGTTKELNDIIMKRLEQQK